MTQRVSQNNAALCSVSQTSALPEANIETRSKRRASFGMVHPQKEAQRAPSQATH
jgi:hypothetical protein